MEDRAAFAQTYLNRTLIKQWSAVNTAKEEVLLESDCLDPS
jgi:hypothetical protein